MKLVFIARAFGTGTLLTEDGENFRHLVGAFQPCDASTNLLSGAESLYLRLSRAFARVNATY